MDVEATKRVARALEAALAVFRDAKGRLSASDIRVQSILSAIRSELLGRADPTLIDWPTITPRPPYPPAWDNRPPEQRH